MTSIVPITADLKPARRQGQAEGPERLHPSQALRGQGAAAG